MSSLFQTLNISRQDMLSRLIDLDVISNNLANINTDGFQANRSNFQEIFETALKQGMQVSSTQLSMLQGNLRETTNPLDWAIQGAGYFSVTLPDGTTAYTRNGSFTLDADLQLVTADGYPLVWDGTITEDITDISVSPTGVVSGLDADRATVELGTVQLTTFPNPTGLTAYTDTLLLESDDSGAAILGNAGDENFGSIYGSKIEGSNVDLSLELTRMMISQRAFSLSVQAFQQTDTMISQAINLRKA